LFRSLITKSTLRGAVQISATRTKETLRDDSFQFLKVDFFIKEEKCGSECNGSKRRSRPTHSCHCELAFLVFPWRHLAVFDAPRYLRSLFDRARAHTRID